jgi:formamidopyrimidine-DNA glycosylase
MPELPEVQTVVDDLKDAGLIGITIRSARVFWSKTIADLAPNQFCRRIQKRRIDDIWRRGKFIIFDFQPPIHLLVHLRMTGRFNLESPSVKRSKHEHVVIKLNNSRELRFQDTRKFGRFYLTADPLSQLARLGPEPLSRGFTAKSFSGMLANKNRILKSLLLDQSFIAGLGNIYVDEALWEARIHPQRKSNLLSFSEVQALHRAIRRVLRRGLINLGTSLGQGRSNFYSVARRRGRNSDHLQVFRRTSDPCPRCRTPIQRLLVGQRSTHFCPNCQIL